MTTRRGYRCGWCGVRCTTPTAHLVHIHRAHPDTIGRGRTRTRPWTCWRCAGESPASTGVCIHCGWRHPDAPDDPLEPHTA